VFKGYIELEPREPCLYFYSFQLFGLDFTPFVLYINPYCIFVLPCKILEDSYLLFFSFFLLALADFLFVFFTSLLPNIKLSKPHACVVYIAFPAILVVVLTLGCCFFKKIIGFGLERVARDKLVFRIKKHGHMSFQMLTRQLQLGFWDGTSDEHPPDRFHFSPFPFPSSSSFFYYHFFI